MGRGAPQIILALAMVTLAGCSLWQRTAAPITSPTRSSSAPTLPTNEPRSRYGNPEFYDVLGKRYVPLKTADGFTERGIASWYGPDFHGGLTSTRETYDMYQMTAAHKVLPLPTWVEVKNLSNGRTTLVRVNDRGPFKDNRIIDLSYAAALQLDIVKAGTAFVEIRAVTSPIASTAPAATAHAPPPMYLQIGAFGERANAERLKTLLDPKFGTGLRIYADPPIAPTLYKVQLGPLSDVAAADHAVAVLEELGISDHHLVTY